MTSKRREPGRALDWARARERLEHAIRATAAAQELSPEAGRALMEQRAERLARTDPEPARGEQLDLVTFSVGRESYAIETRWVHEIARLTTLTPVPGAPHFISGVTAWRGEVLPVFDVARFSGTHGHGLNELSRVLIIGIDRPELGVLADAVRDVARVEKAQLQAPPRSTSTLALEIIAGVTGDALIVIDGRALLEHPQLAGARSNEEN